MTDPEETARTPEETVRAVLDGVCRVSTGDASALDEVQELYADILHPMHPEIPPIRTREDLLRHFAVLRDRMTSLPTSRAAVDVRVHTTTDPEVVVTEFRYWTVVDGNTLITPCIWVTRVRDGRIVEGRDHNGRSAPMSQ